jgi:hypothetical protein
MWQHITCATTNNTMDEVCELEFFITLKHIIHIVFFFIHSGAFNLLYFIHTFLLGD